MIELLHTVVTQTQVVRGVRCFFESAIDLTSRHRADYRTIYL
eukprot:SAG31_NODE_1105_length_9882_cov_5.270571_4_plen_42_part_00